MNYMTPEAARARRRMNRAAKRLERAGRNGDSKLAREERASFEREAQAFRRVRPEVRLS